MSYYSPKSELSPSNLQQLEQYESDSDNYVVLEGIRNPDGSIREVDGFVVFGRRGQEEISEK